MRNFECAEKGGVFSGVYRNQGAEINTSNQHDRLIISNPTLSVGWSELIRGVFARGIEPSPAISGLAAIPDAASA